MSEFADLIANLGGGTFENQLVQALRNVALNVVEQHKKGQVCLTFDFKQIGESSQVECSHTLAYKQPTLRGQVSEDVTVKTPLHVGPKGVLSLFPHESGDLFKKREDIA